MADSKRSSNAVHTFSVIYRFPKDNALQAEAKCLTILQGLRTLDIVERFVRQLEKGEQKGVHHLQSYVRVHPKQRKQTLLAKLRGFIALSEEPDLRHESANGYAAQATRTYCMKAETRVAGPWNEDPTWKLYTGQDLAAIRTNKYLWQTTITELLTGQPDHRTINWIFDPSGNTGKTWFIKLRIFDYHEQHMSFGTSSQLKTSLCEIGPKRAYHIDIPRSIGKDDRDRDLLSALEYLKSGMVSTSMYGKYKQMIFEPPHVICYANRLPNPYLMSLDRWRVFRIYSKHLPLVQMPTCQVCQEYIIQRDKVLSQRSAFIPPKPLCSNGGFDQRFAAAAPLPVWNEAAPAAIEGLSDYDLESDDDDI